MLEDYKQGWARRMCRLGPQCIRLYILYDILVIHIMGLCEPPNVWFCLTLVISVHRCAGRLAKGQTDAEADSILWFQAHSSLLQLYAAAWTACTVISKIASEIEAAMSDIQSLIQEVDAVPKQAVLPIFHRIGKLFEVSYGRCYFE